MQIPWTDGDYAEVTANVEGEMTVSGQMQVKPYVNITKVYSFTGLSISVPVGTVAQTDYSTPAIKVAYPTQIVHIPLPNVHAPESLEALVMRCLSKQADDRFASMEELQVSLNQLKKARA